MFSVSVILNVWLPLSMISFFFILSLISFALSTPSSSVNFAWNQNRLYQKVTTKIYFRIFLKAFWGRLGVFEPLSLSCKFHKLVSLRTFLVWLSISTSRLSVSTSPMSSSWNINLPDYERLCILVLFIRKMISNIKTSKVNLSLVLIKGYLL